MFSWIQVASLGGTVERESSWRGIKSAESDSDWSKFFWNSWNCSFVVSDFRRRLTLSSFFTLLRAKRNATSSWAEETRPCRFVNIWFSNNSKTPDSCFSFRAVNLISAERIAESWRWSSFGKKSNDWEGNLRMILQRIVESPFLELETGWK